MAGTRRRIEGTAEGSGIIAELCPRLISEPRDLFVALHGAVAVAEAESLLVCRRPSEALAPFYCWPKVQQYSIIGTGYFHLT